MTYEWVPGVAVAIAGTALTAWRNIAVIDTKLDQMEKREIESRHDAQQRESALTADMKAAVNDLRTVASDIRSLSETQAIINRVNNKALDSIVTRLDQHDTMLRDHGISIGVLQRNERAQ